AAKNGGGGLMTASNGLNVIGRAVQLGGMLIVPTNIEPTSGGALSVGPSGSRWLTVRSSSLDLGLTSSSALRANATGLSIIGTTGILQYNSDKFSSYDDRTVPDWGNVKARTAFGSGLVPFGNATSDGLTTGQLSFN